MRTGRLYHINRRLARSRKLILIGIIIASALVRISYYHNLSSGPLINQHKWTETDMNYFDRWARAIAAGDWLSRNVDPPMHSWMSGLADSYYAEHPDRLPTAQPGENDSDYKRRRDLELWKNWIGRNRYFQEPLYPYLIATTYKVAGKDVRFVFLVQMAFGIGLNVLIYLVARRAFGDLAGLIAGIIAVLYSPLLLYELVLLRDSLVAFMTMLLTCLVFRVKHAPTPKHWALLGLFCGISFLLKSHFVIGILIIAAWMVFRFRAQKSLLVRAAGTFAIFFLIALIPLIVRNIKVGTSPFAAAGNAAASVIIANSEDSDAAAWGFNHFVEIQDSAGGRLFPTWLAAIRTHPSFSHYLSLIAQKFDIAWRWYEQPSNENFYYYRMYSLTLIVLPFTWYLVAPLALVGLAISIPRFRRIWPAFLPLFINLPVLLLFFGQARYRIPLAAGMIPFAALTIQLIIISAMSRRWNPLVVTLILVVVTILWTGRSYPDDYQRIRPADFEAPFGYYYQPLIKDALARGDKVAAAEIITKAVSYCPPLITEFKPGTFPRNSDEVGIMYAFSKIYGFQAQVLMQCGRKEDAIKAMSLSKELARAAGMPTR